jgi:hypothetical protein
VRCPVDELMELFAAMRADNDAEPFAHDNQWVGDQTTEVPR